MNFDLTMKRLAKKHGFDYTVEPLKFGASRAVIECGSWAEIDYIRSTLQRVRGMSVNTWACGAIA